jgi:hypothetical protein
MSLTSPFIDKLSDVIFDPFDRKHYLSDGGRVSNIWDDTDTWDDTGTWEDYES